MQKKLRANVLNAIPVEALVLVIVAANRKFAFRVMHNHKQSSHIFFLSRNSLNIKVYLCNFLHGRLHTSSGECKLLFCVSSTSSFMTAGGFPMQKK